MSLAFSLTLFDQGFGFEDGWPDGFFYNEGDLFFSIGGFPEIGQPGVGDEVPFMYNDDAIAKGLDLLEYVGGEKDRPVFSEVADEFTDFDDLVGVQTRRGFIEDEDAGLVEQGCRRRWRDFCPATG